MKFYEVKYPGNPVTVRVSTNTRGRRSKRMRRAIRAAKRDTVQSWSKAFWLLWRPHECAWRALPEADIVQTDVVKVLADGDDWYCRNMFTVTGFINMDPPRVEMDFFPRQGTYTTAYAYEVEVVLQVGPR